MVKKSTDSEIEFDPMEIIKIVVVLYILYLIYTNLFTIMVGGIVGILLFLIITVVAAYYILPRIGITALAGLISALASLVGASKGRQG